MKTATAVRSALALLALIVPLLVMLITWMLWREELPDEIASHWTGVGAADGTLATQTAFSIALIATAAAAGAGLLVSIIRNLNARIRRNLFFVFGLVAGTGMAVWLIPVLLTIQAGSPAEAVLGWWLVPQILLPAYGIIPVLLMPVPVIVSYTEHPRVQLMASESGAYTTTTFGGIFLWCVAALLGFGGLLYGAAIVDGRAAENALGIVSIVVGVLLAGVFAHLRVSIDWRGLRVTSGLFHIPLKRISVDQVKYAESAVLLPMQWGGWGYRVTAGRSAIILRRGPGLIVTKTNGKQFAVTISDPDIPAALLNTLRGDLS